MLLLYTCGIAKRRREEKDIDLVSLGSDDDDDKDDGDDDHDVENSEGVDTSGDGAREGVHRKREKKAAGKWGFGLQAPVSSSRSFLTSFAATAGGGGGAGARANQKPAT